MTPPQPSWPTPAMTLPMAPPLQQRPGADPGHDAEIGYESALPYLLAELAADHPRG